MRRFGLLVLLSCCIHSVSAQQSPPADASPQSGVIRQIDFEGLRRVPVESLRARITVREGAPLDPRQIERDVRTLDDLGWFESVSVRVELVPLQLAAEFGLPRLDLFAAESVFPSGLLSTSIPLLRLVFVLEERPYLAGVDFAGSELLNASDITQILSARGLDLKLASPSNRTELWRASRAIESELAERGRPQARAQLRLVPLPTDAVLAEFYIVDGPRIAAGRVDFLGNLAFSNKTLRNKMDRIAPHAWFAGLRGKDVFTPERLALDRERIERYYRNHGYPQARLGEAQVEIVKKKVLDWLPWPRRKEQEQFRIFIPVQEGPQFRIESFRVEGGGLEKLDGLPESIGSFKPGETYSEEKLLHAQEELARLPLLRKADGSRHVVDLDQQFDAGTGSVQVVLRARPTEAYVIRRIEFTGHHRFSDRFYRRRVRLVEGEPFDETRLEEGLKRLADSGFIRAATPDDIKLTWDHEKRTVDVTITVEEIGRQRISFSGGASGWGSTAGIAYNLFDMLGGEELITGQLEGGPESLITAVQLAKEGMFGSRASFGLSFYRTVVRPRLPGSGGSERLFSANSIGLSQSWTQPLGKSDTIAFQYDLARTTSRTPAATGISLGDGSGETLRRTSRSSAAVTWMRQSRTRRLESSAAVAGGPLGGDEKFLRASAEGARIDRDRLSRGRNAWAFRGLAAAVKPHSGATLPLQTRLFGGGEVVRGLRDAEFTPFAVVNSADAGGHPMSRAFATGANVVAAVNAEYRVPLQSSTELAAFFDAASAWSFDRLLGSALLAGTNGRWRASSGLELRWQMPATLLGAPNPLAGETLRLHYAVNVLRLGRAVLLGDGSLFRLPERRGAAGWALGKLF